MPPIPRFDLVYDLVDNHEGRRRILVENLENIFDTYYIASSYADVWTMPGAPRNVRVTLRGRF